MSGLFYLVVADVTIRDEQSALVSEERVRVRVYGIDAVPGVVMDIVRQAWPESTPADVHWSRPLHEWDGSGRISWSTCAEVDGTVYVAQQEDNVHG